eukprot:gene5337-12932_t
MTHAYRRKEISPRPIDMGFHHLHLHPIPPDYNPHKLQPMPSSPMPPYAPKPYRFNGDNDYDPWATSMHRGLLANPEYHQIWLDSIPDVAPAHQPSHPLEYPTSPYQQETGEPLITTKHINNTCMDLIIACLSPAILKDLPGTNVACELLRQIRHAHAPQYHYAFQYS